MSEEPVDVLIVGAGASGAALAWSLAETRMQIVCLEQGEWMDPATYPGMQGDWELRQLGDFSFSPNTRAPTALNIEVAIGELLSFTG